MFSSFQDKTAEINSKELTRLLQYNSNTMPNLSLYDKNIKALVKTQGIMFRKKLVNYFKRLAKSRGANAVTNEARLYKIIKNRILFSHRTDPYRAHEFEPFPLATIQGKGDDEILEFDLHTKEGEGEEGAPNYAPNYAETVEGRLDSHGLPSLLCCSPREMELIILFTKALKLFPKFLPLNDTEIVFILIHLINSLLYLEPSDDYLGIITKEISRSNIRKKNRKLAVDLYYELSAGNLTIPLGGGQLFLSRMFRSKILNLNTPLNELLSRDQLPQPNQSLVHRGTRKRHSVAQGSGSGSGSGSEWSDSSVDSSSSRSDSSYLSSSNKSSHDEIDGTAFDLFPELLDALNDSMAAKHRNMHQPPRGGGKLYKTMKRRGKRARTTRRTRRVRESRKPRKHCT
jgi:hypothetical protein